jgi:hypothetical protein
LSGGGGTKAAAPVSSRVDQPYYCGEWVPAADSEFIAELL